MSKLNDAFWAIARQMTKRQPSEYENLKVFCPVCEMDYCLDFAGQDAFCNDCRYLGNCLKTIIHKRICQHCGRKKNE